MAPHIRLIGLYGNGLVAVAFVIFMIIAMSRGDIGAALLCLSFAALAVFNVYLTQKASTIFSEEEWLQSEIRKAELRRKFVNLNGRTPEAIGRQHGL